MKIKNVILLAVFIAFTTVLDAMATEARRARFIIRIYKKGMELNTINDFMKALDEKRKEETKEFVEGWTFVKNAVNGRKRLGG